MGAIVVGDHQVSKYHRLVLRGMHARPAGEGCVLPFCHSASLEECPNNAAATRRNETPLRMQFVDLTWEFVFLNLMSQSLLRIQVDVVEHVVVKLGQTTRAPFDCHTHVILVL